MLRWTTGEVGAEAGIRDCFAMVSNGGVVVVVAGREELNVEERKRKRKRAKRR